jgi:hypothetical protein
MLQLARLSAQMRWPTGEAENPSAFAIWRSLLETGASGDGGQNPGPGYFLSARAEVSPLLTMPLHWPCFAPEINDLARP